MKTQNSCKAVYLCAVCAPAFVRVTGLICPYGDLQSASLTRCVLCSQVGDRCSECEDDHIDILQERPFSWAPFDPKRGHDNYHAPYVNAKSGLRGFRDPAAMRSTGISPESVGAWTTDWQFVPCSYTHDQCAALMKDMGYSNVWTPSWTEGLDSWSLRPVASLRTANPRLTQEPHSGRKLMGQH
jgi:hypothetical protein